MTVASLTNKSGPYNGNGSTTNFAVNTKYTDKSEVTVIVTSSAGVETTKTLDTHYTLTAPGDSGTVSFITSPTDFRPQTGETVTIITVLALTQATDMTVGGNFSANVIEGAFDKLTRLVHQIAEKVTRAPKLRQTSTTGEVLLPEPSALAFLRWNSGADALENGTTGGPGSGDVVGPASSTDNAIARFDGTSGGALQNSGVTISDTNIMNGAVAVGVNATADTTNRLSVNSAAVLFNHEGAGTQIKVNKNASGNTASYLFQTGFSGRAEFGTIADNDFTLKTSADGSAFTTALIADNATGALRVGVNLRPSANDGAALGTTTVGWSDAFFATGGTLNWVNGDVTITHSSNALAFAGASSGYSFDSTVSISPAAASTTKAINAAQTGPTSGTHGSTLDFNTLAIGSEQVSVSGTVYGLAVTHGFGGSNALGQRTAIRGLLVMNTATSASQPLGQAYSAVSGEGQMSAADNGTNTGAGAKGTMIGLYGSSIAAAGATNLHRMAGAEINTAIRATASARYHVGVQITQWGDHSVSGAELDAGLQFGNQSGAVGWDDYGIVFDVSSAGLGTLFTANATIIGTKGAVTAAQGINFESATFTGAAFASNGFFVNGAGSVVSAIHVGGLGTGSSLSLQSTTGVGATDFIRFLVGNNGATEAARILNAGQVIVGHTAAIAMNSEAGAAFTPQVQIQAAGAAATMSISRWSANANQGRLAFAKSRGAAIGTRGIVADGDALGTFLFDGDDGTNFIPGAAISAVVFGTPGTNDMPTALEFSTTADGAAVTTRHLRIGPTGLITALTPTGGLGYGTGAGGAQTQATSKSTTVVSNTACGQITMNNATLNANTTVSFTLTNSVIAATDQIIIDHISGGTLFNYSVVAVAGAGSATVSVRNITAGNLSDALVLKFTVIKSVNS